MPISLKDTANITTANWGTARTLTIGNTGKSVNGSGNVSWSLSEIGAAPAGYGLGTTCQDKSNQDCNNILVTGFYRGSNMTNKPSGCTQGWIYLLVMSHDNSSWVRQVAYDFGTASQVYTRVKQNGSWTSWVATDNNTWRGVQDNLTSTATDQSLSANQGKVLKGLIDGKAASNHTHSYVPLANGGNITIHADSDSSSTGEYALIKAGHNELKIASSAGGTTVTKGQDKLTFNGNIVYHAGRKPTISEIGAAAASHTHNYAGSSSAGGAANSANLLNIAGGRAASANSAVIVGPNTSMMLSTSSMTTGKPASDGYITEYRWDNNGGWSAQLFVPNNTTGVMQYRSMNAGTWGNWNTIYSTCNPQTTITGNAGTATKLQTVRSINGTNFDGSANITTANWGTARNLNGVSVNGSTNYTIPVENYYCYVGDNNTNLYHRILTTDIATTNWVDKSLIIVMHSGYQGGGFGIAKITLRTNDISSAANSSGEIRWLVRSGFAENALVFNLVNQAKNACMDVFYKSPANYAGMRWYVLSEGGRGEAHSKQWTKYNTNASGTNAYTEANMKTLRTYTSTLVSAKDAGHVSTANSAHTLATARTINGTSFNGSGNITTANWGTARNLQIGNTAKSVNGSANVSWSLSEIGAMGATNANGYWGLTAPDGNTSNWIRTTNSGIIPYQSGGASALGTSSWPFSNAYINTVYGNLSGNATTATTSNYLTSNSRMDYGWNGLNYFNISGTAGTAVKANNTPTTAWWHIMRFNHANSSGYYTDLAVPFNHNSLYYKVIQNGALVNNGWVKVLDSLNYNEYAPTKTGGGASGNWGISITGNSATATKLQTVRSINGTNFDGTGNITTANWGTARNIQIGNTAKSVNGSGNVSWSLAEIGAAPSSSTSLNTTDKTIVGAINEVFQSGNSVKQNLVDTLIAKGAEDISTSNSWDSLIDIIEGSNISLAPTSFTVENVSGSDYGFRLLDSGPYYESENFGIHNSYAMCKLNIVCNSNYNVYLDCINYAENSFDYGIISQINTPLTPSYQADTTGVLKSFKGQSSPEVQTVHLGSESGFYYIKYVKDSSASQGNDSLRFKVRFEKKTGGNPGVPGNPGGKETILFSPTIGGDNRSLTGGYTHKMHTSDSYFMHDASCMDLMAYSNGRSNNTLETVISQNKINLTNYSRLSIKAYFTTTTNDSGGAPLVGFDAVGNRDSAFAASMLITSSGQRYYDLDISGLTGNYHLKFNVATSLVRPSTGEITKHLYITELILYP